MDGPTQSMATETRPRSRIPIARPDLSFREQQNVENCFANGWLTQGKWVAQAEDRLKAITGRKFAICTSSGTAALLAALLAIRTDWSPWTVAAPVLTFAAVHNAIRLAGGVVWPMGADRESWQVPVKEWNEIRWDAAIVAPCYGKVEGSDVATLAGISQRFKVIEDAAESFGGSINGCPAGSFGDISCISFYANKIVTAGEGGAVLTNDPLLDRKLRTAINHGIDNKLYVPSSLGFNGRMTDVQAAILCGQLDMMPTMIRRRLQIMEEYKNASAGRWTLRSVAPGEVLAPWLFSGIPDDSQKVWADCRRENIECRPFFPITVGGNNTIESIASARTLSAKGLCLPLSSALTDVEVERVCEVIHG